GPETELEHSRLIRERRARQRLPELGVRFVQGVRLEVRAVEHIEHLKDAIELHLRPERESPLDAHVDAVQRRLVEAVPRDERPVLAEAAAGTPPATARRSPMWASSSRCRRRYRGR